jgi:putative ABC transport system permease protein
MRWIDVIRIATRMLVVNFLRTLLTSLGIATAIALIVVLTGLGYGVQDITIGSIVNSKSLLSMDVFTPTDAGILLDDDTYEAIRTLPEVQEISQVFTSEAQVSFGGKLVSNSLNAVNSNYIGMDGVTIAEGRNFTDGQPEIVLSPQTLNLLERTSQEVLGQQLVLSYLSPNDEQELHKIETPFTVVGITRGEDSTAMFVSYELLRSQPKVYMTSIKVTAKNRDSLVSLQQRLTQRGYGVETLLDTLDSARQVFRSVTIGLVIIALIALVIASIGMFNTLTITLLERTREIGIMKAIGVTNKDVKRLFLAESIILGALGGILGVLSGLGIDSVVNKILDLLANRFGGASLQIFRYPPWFLLGMILFPALLGLATGLYPSIRASRLNPLQALRYE